MSEWACFDVCKFCDNNAGDTITHTGGSIISEDQ